MVNKNRLSKLEKLEQVRKEQDERPPQIKYISVIKDLGNGEIEVEQNKMGTRDWKIVYRGTREGFKQGYKQCRRIAD